MDIPVYALAIIVFALLAILFITVIVMAVKTYRARKREAHYKKLTLECIRSLVESIDAMDPYTRGHSMRVAEYSVEIARRLGIRDRDSIYYAALLHDVGKINIPDYVLKKNGRLEADEYELMKQHPEFGGNILSGVTAVPGIVDGALYHHERYDGSGYNKGLRGDDIPLYGRIIGVADAYDAMTCARSYRRGLSKDEARTELERYSGSQFDPKIAGVMIKMIDDGFIAY